MYYRPYYYTFTKVQKEKNKNFFIEIKKMISNNNCILESFSRNNNKTGITTFIKKGAQMDKRTLINKECPHIEFC